MSAIHSNGPFLIKDVFDYTLSKFLDFSDISICACVCVEWSQFAKESAVWKHFFVNMGIPMVADRAHNRDYRSDFKTLYSLTAVSGEVYRKIFGEPEGKIPSISVDVFESLSKPDPFEPEKLQKETFQFIVEFPFIQHTRTLGRIPFTLNNRVELLKKEHLPVFRHFLDTVLQQCDYTPAKVNVYYQRKKIAGETIGLNYPEQRALVEERGFKVLPLGPRLLSDAVEILLFGTCPDENKLCARTSTMLISSEGQPVQVAIGNFYTGEGVSVCLPSIPLPTRDLGVVVGILAEGQ